MNKNINLNLSWDFLNALYHVEALRHSEENTDRTIVFNISFTWLFLYTHMHLFIKKIIDAKINNNKI